MKGKRKFMKLWKMMVEDDETKLMMRENERNLTEIVLKIE
jgi:hypothetical protein